MEQEHLEFAKEIACKAGEIMLKYFKGDNGADYKYDQTIVTKADTEINHCLIQRVREVYPTHAVEGEEERFGESRFVWVCDPIDGTAMYARHIPTSVFSLALVVDGAPQVGVVYDPFANNLYTAAKGQGAYLNGKRMQVSQVALDQKESVAHFDMWPAAEYNLFDAFKELGKTTYFVGLGSIIRAAMCVANGEFTLALFPGTVHKHFDIAAVKVIVEEAGGKVTDLFGNEQRYDRDINGAIISNGITHKQALAAIQKTIHQKDSQPLG